MRWYKFDFSDYWVEIYGLADAEDLAYRRLRDLYYQNEGPLPADSKLLESEICLDWDCIEPVLLRFFIQKDGHWLHQKWQLDIEKRLRVRESNAKAGRIGGKIGGKALRKKRQPV